MLTRLKTVFFLLALIAAPMSAHADEVMSPTDRGPAIGAEVSFPNPLETHEGEMVALDALYGEKGVAIFFNRSLDWCPFCKKQTNKLIQNTDAFVAAGYTPVVLTYDSAAKLNKYAKDNGAEFALLSDPDSATIDAFGLRNEEVKPGSFADGIPHPMIVVVGKDGRVEAKFAEEGYRKRPDFDFVIAELSQKGGS